MAKGTRKARSKRKAGKKAAKQPTQVITLGKQPGSLAPAVRQVCALTNPFCPAAWGARWPDNSMTRSNGWSAKYAQALPVDTNGNLARLYLPTLEYPVVPGTVTGGTAAYPTRANVVAPPTNVSRWRITSWGIRIRCLTPPLTTQGTVRVRLFSPMQFASLANVDIATYYADAFYDVPLRRLIDEDLFVVPMPLGTAPRIFRDVNFSDDLDIALGENPGWQVVSVAVDGAPSGGAAPTIEVMCYYNYELVFADGEATSFYARPPPPENKMITDSTGNVLDQAGNFFEGVAERVDRVFQSKALKYLTGAVGYAMGGPRGAMVAYSGTKMVQDVD